MVLVHNNDIHIEVPTFVEVNPMNTIREVQENVNQLQWEHMSTGQLFKTIWYEIFETTPTIATNIPEQIEDLKRSDYGQQHVAGLIILACEAMFDGKSVFFRTPECHLHPKQERCLMSGIRMMRQLLGGANAIIEMDRSAKDALDKPDVSAHETLVITKKAVDKVTDRVRFILRQFGEELPEEPDEEE